MSMLTAKLLLSNPSDEEALECLCRLLTTVGQALDKETNERMAKGPVPASQTSAATSRR